MAEREHPMDGRGARAGDDVGRLSAPDLASAVESRVRATLLAVGAGQGDLRDARLRNLRLDLPPGAGHDEVADAVAEAVLHALRGRRP